jgi:hypothetical protein
MAATLSQEGAAAFVNGGFLSRRRFSFCLLAQTINTLTTRAEKRAVASVVRPRR